MTRQTVPLSVGTATREREQNALQPGDDFAHFCRVHATEGQCEAAPESCVAYCGYRWHDDDDLEWNDGQDPECVVCFHMEPSS